MHAEARQHYDDDYDQDDFHDDPYNDRYDQELFYLTQLAGGYHDTLITLITFRFAFSRYLIRRKSKCWTR